ncbi:MAG: HNH endonuclease signature motif containing protein [Candidatus Cryptobacteroides sp.]
MGANINEFSHEEVCDYKGRRYFVRDNGAIYRQCKNDGSVRKNDEEWTFGKPGTDGYLFISSERVHRIVCTAYHGEPIGDRNIVDHIDTNRKNNRPENLRWVTRLENTLNNPITRAKVESICGSIENFLKNPSLLYGHESEDKNFSWMRTVSREEAERSLKRWKEWAEKPVEERKPKDNGVSEWIYQGGKNITENKSNRRFQYVGPYNSYAEHMAAVEEMNHIEYDKQYGLKDSLTSGAKQLNWKTPTEFLLCPKQNEDRTLNTYLYRLIKGKMFTRTQYGDGGTVKDADINPEDNAIFVLTENGSPIKPWALCKITLQDGFFVHENQGSFFSEECGDMNFTLAIGKEWDGEYIFDD